MKIIFFGTPQFAVPTLQILAKIATIEIQAVVTQPDKPVGRKQILTPPPVKIAAEKLKIPVIQETDPKKLRKMLESYSCDFYIVIAYGMILTNEILKLPKIAPINVHASLLPKYRGASPIQEALLNGDKETGISIMRMDSKMDTGPVYFIKRVNIDPEDNFENLHNKLANESAKILPLALADVYNNLLRPVPQKRTGASYCKKITKTDGQINWGLPAKKILNMIRAYTPWPTAYTNLNGKKVQILKAKIIQGEEVPGKISIVGNLLQIGTGKGILLPLILKPEGKKEMPVSDFINGNKELIQNL